MDNFFSVAFWETTPWIQQIAALLTIFAIPYILIRYFTYRAKHKIRFIPGETYHQVQVIDHPNQPQSLWLQLMVKNRGLEVSKNVKGYLSEIWRDIDGKLKRLDNFRAPVQLKWSHEADFRAIDIFPRASRRLDVCYMCDGEKFLRIMAEGFPSGSIKNTLEVGKYIFVVKVIGENSLFPATFLFEVTCEEAWKKLRGQSYVESFRLTTAPANSFRIY